MRKATARAFISPPSVIRGRVRKGVPDVSKKILRQIARRAKRLGVGPEDYSRDLVENDLALDREIQATTITKIVGRGRKIDTYLSKH